MIVSSINVSNNSSYSNMRRSLKNKAIQHRISFGNNISNVSVQENELIDDGINDIPSSSLKSTPEVVSPLQEFLDEEASKNKDIDLHSLDLQEFPEIEMPKIEPLEDIIDIPPVVEDSAKSSKMLKPILLFVGLGTAITSVVYFFLKNKQQKKNLNKQA